MKQNVEEQELITVIAAAVAMVSGQSPEQFRIHSITQLTSNRICWNKAGRMDQMASRRNMNNGWK